MVKLAKEKRDAICKIADRDFDRETVLNETYVAGWNAAVAASAMAIKDFDRTGRDWVPSSLWDTICRTFEPTILKLKR